MSLSNAETALLGLLQEGEKHPYQVEKEIEQRSMREWTDLSMSSVYKLLVKLQKQGLVSSRREVSEENRLRKIYRITDEGRSALRESLKSILAEPEPYRSRMDVAISNLNVLPLQEVIQLMQEYRIGLEKRIAGYQALEAYLVGENCPAFRLAFAHRPIALTRGEIAWVDDYINALQQGGELK